MKSNLVSKMRLEKKAFYNLLRQKWLADPDLKVEPWQVEDLRDLSTQELLRSLEALGISLSEESFLLYAENAENPEELTEALCSEEEKKDAAYLLLFELWRRQLPEKTTLSIFCDEFDARTALYEKDPERYDSSIQNILLKLEEILEEGSDQGMPPQECLKSLSRHCIKDPETFLYEYVSDQIEAQNDLYAAELIEDFHPYVLDTLWFDFASGRLLAASDPHEANVVFKSILDEMKEEPDLDLLLEMSAFLVSHGDPHLFYQAARQAFELIHTEEDFQELLAICANYCRCCEMLQKENRIKTIFAGRSAKNLNDSLDKTDKDVALFESLLTPTLLP